MKLAEALILRADAWKRVLQVRERLNRVARVQEGETPAEAPLELLVEHDRALAEFTALVKRINRTNSVTAFDAGRSLTDALADRDAIAHERATIHSLIANANGGSGFRLTRTELRFVATVDVAALQKRADDLARRHRELDTAIQALNWTVDLLD